MVSAAIVVALATLLAAWLAVESRARAPETSSLAGIWVRNPVSSDPPPAISSGPVGRNAHGRREFGGADALRDVIDPPEHLTIMQTDSMVAMVGPDGRATRLATDGSIERDAHTQIERRSHWDDGKLVSEIRSSTGKMTQILSIDRDKRQLRIVVDVEAARDRPARTVTHVYDPDV